MKPLQVFIGWDSREIAAYHVLCHSLIRRSSIPLSITPLLQPQLRAKQLYTRQRGPLESTEFSLTRFLVPFLSNFQGLSVFMDCDMLALADIEELLSPIDYSKTVWVVQHDYTPKTTIKMEGQIQSVYPRKNWSSLMIFNNARCRMLTPHFVNTAIPGALHQFGWTRDKDIGSLPKEWNYLVGEPAQSPNPPKMLHYTLGGPWFRNYQFCDYANEWFQELDLAFPSLNVPKPAEV
jgi:hypothetical protein